MVKGRGRNYHRSSDRRCKRDQERENKGAKTLKSATSNSVNESESRRIKLSLSEYSSTKCMLTQK